MRRNTVVLIFVALLLLFGATALLAAPERPVTLTSTLEVKAWSHGPAEPVTVDFALANPGRASVWVLRWQTPLDGIDADLFDVQRDGEPVAYTGRLIKRAAPEAGDYVEVPPGQTLSVEFDLSAAYDMSVRGEYSVRYRATLQDVMVERVDQGPFTAQREDSFESIAMASVESNAVRFFVDGREPGESYPPELSIQKKPGGGGTGQFINCTNTQQSTLLTALANALSISTKAKTYLGSGRDSGGLYATWFDYYGTVNNGWSTATSHFNALTDAFATKPISFNCGCNQNYYAYVYPTQPYTIYLCRVFWTAPALGTDSKAGTLVHETSHFNVVAGTDDWVYGTAGALNLAKTAPAKALDNADNHEYFAENQK